MPKKEKRFIYTYPDGMNGPAVVIDRQTGINYIGTSYSFTPLRNADGTIMVTGIPAEEK